MPNRDITISRTVTCIMHRNAQIKNLRAEYDFYESIYYNRSYKRMEKSEEQIKIIVCGEQAWSMKLHNPFSQTIFTVHNEFDGLRGAHLNCSDIPDHEKDFKGRSM